MTESTAPVTRESEISLREITADTVYSFIRLKVHPDQEKFVAANANSMAEAYFEREQAWFRGIYADETPVGFVMLYDDPIKPEYFLWRYMIDGRYQRMGFGARALRLVIEYVRSRPNATEMALSYTPGEGSPQPFYAGLGFVDTGEMMEEEMVMKLAL